MRVVVLLMAACGAGSDPEPAPSTAYPGTWTGLCEHLRDCGCSPFEATDTCATVLESGYEGGLARARELGLPEDQLAERAMSAEEMSDIANTPCPTLCEEAAVFSRASGLSR